MSTHDIESPSSLQALSLCPGMNQAQRGLPDTFSPSSIKGTAAHVLLEKVVDGAEHLLDYTDMNLSVDTPGYTEDVTLVKLDSEDIEAVKVAYDYVCSKWIDTTEVYSEVKVNPESFIAYSKSKGTADLIVSDVVEGVQSMEVIDYKHGRGFVVEVEDNLQLITYGIGGLAMLEAYGVHVENITLTIAQPLIHHRDGFIRSVTMSRSKLLDWVPSIKDTISYSRQAGAPRKAGEYQCRHCKAKRNCPAIAAHAMNTVRATFTPLGEVTTDMVGASLTRDPVCLSPGQRGMVLENASLIRGWLDAVAKHAWMEDLKGSPTPGFKVVEGISKRKYIDSEDETLAVLRTLRTKDKKRLALKELTKLKILSPKQLISKLKPVLADKTLKRVNALITKPTGSMTMVPDTDPRDAFVKKPEDVFKPIATKKKVDLSFLD